jgi:RNA polymerase sigma-70 factor, ECF subfamily
MVLPFVGSTRMSEAIHPTSMSDFVDGNLGVTRAAAFAPARNARPYRAMRAESDQLSALMDSYANGDDVVFEPLYALLAPPLYRFCLRLTARRADADDCFQETLLKLHRSRATYVSGANVLHWAFAIARSIYLTRGRYWRRRPEFIGAIEDVAGNEALHGHVESTPESQAMALDVLEAASVELNAMSEKNRIAYILTKQEDVSAQDAATILGTTAEVVRQRAHRAYAQLRTAIDRTG